jgi:hypothetical protein
MIFVKVILVCCVIPNYINCLSFKNVFPIFMQETPVILHVRGMGCVSYLRNAITETQHGVKAAVFISLFARESS